MRPNKVFGLTDAERNRRCTGKRRWSDELSARAGAIRAVEHRDIPEGLYVYRCPECQGWHLTRKKQKGQQPTIRGGLLA